MKASLRKRHLHIWLLIALLLPIAFAWAYLNIPQPPRDEIFQSNPIEQLPELKVERDLPGIKVNLFSSESGRLHQVEVVIKEPIASPAAKIFLVAKGDEERLLGDVGSMGVYRWLVPGDEPLGLVFYDIVKKKELHRVLF